MVVVSARVRQVSRLHDRPIVEAGSAPDYGAVFNAGLLYHDGLYHLFARGVRDGYRRNEGSGPRLLDYISDVLVLTSSDGRSYEFEYVLGRAGTSGVHCFEDPRVQRVQGAHGEDIVMTYTSLPPYESGHPWRIGAHHLSWDGERFHLDEATGRLLGRPDVANKDAIVFTLTDQRVALIHRIHPDMQLAVFDDLDHLWHAGPEYWDPYMSDLDAHTLLRPTPGALGIGAGASGADRRGTAVVLRRAPCRRRLHGQRRAAGQGQGRLVSQLDEPLLEPELEWEREGDMENVVFVQGAQRHGDTVYLTYGAADRCVGVATARVSHLVKALLDAA
jgi:predicted GH43/DUF377 family glycosyl hydrolase